MRNALLGVLTAALFVMLPARGDSADFFPGAEWRHIPGWEAGWSKSGLEGAHDRAAALNSTALMLVHHGIVVAEWGDTAKRTELASVRKSLLNALIGIAVAKHVIDLDATLGDRKS